VPETDTQPDRLTNLPPCLIGMEASVGAHHLSRGLHSLGHNVCLIPAKYVRPYRKGHKNDFSDAEAIAEAVQQPTMKFAATKTADQWTCKRCIAYAAPGKAASGIINQIVPSCWSAV
jgi:transposase